MPIIPKKGTAAPISKNIIFHNHFSLLSQQFQTSAKKKDKTLLRTELQRCDLTDCTNANIKNAGPFLLSLLSLSIKSDQKAPKNE